MWLVPLVGILVAAGLVAVVIYAGDDAKTSSHSGSGELVWFEIRALPKAEIRVDGKKAGTTPISLQLAKGTRQVTIEATMTRHLVNRTGTKDEVYKDTRVLTPDRDQVVDFKLATAKLVESTTSDEK